MPRKPKSPLPNVRGYFFSESEYMNQRTMGDVKIYARSDAGFWFVNGVQTPDKDIPTDLWPVRMVQK